MSILAQKSFYIAGLVLEYQSCKPVNLVQAPYPQVSFKGILANHLLNLASRYNPFRAPNGNILGPKVGKWV